MLICGFDWEHFKSVHRLIATSGNNPPDLRAQTYYLKSPSNETAQLIESARLQFLQLVLLLDISKCAVFPISMVNLIILDELVCCLRVETINYRIWYNSNVRYTVKIWTEYLTFYVRYSWSECSKCFIRYELLCRECPEIQDNPN